MVRRWSLTGHFLILYYPNTQGLMKYWRRAEEMYCNKRGELKLSRVFPADAAPEILLPTSWYGCPCVL
jgi:hypothetical protein